MFGDLTLSACAACGATPETHQINFLNPALAEVFGPARYYIACPQCPCMTFPAQSPATAIGQWERWMFALRQSIAEPKPQ